MNWIELHTNTRYSDVLSFIEPNQMVSACARHGCQAVAITDRNTVQAYLSAEQEAAKRGIALIYGLTIDCMDRDDRYAVTLLARNMKGRDQIFDLVKLMKRFSDMCDALNVHDVGSLCRALSLNHGTGIWIDNQDKLYQEGRIIAKQIITCREDIYRYLTERGASPEEAASFMNVVRRGKIKGRGFTETDLTLLKRCEAEEWFISVCRTVEYLFPESHSIAYAILMIRLVWYVLHYPDVTDSLMIETAMQLLQE